MINNAIEKRINYLIVINNKVKDVSSTKKSYG